MTSCATRKYRIVATDLDGTLLDKSHKVPDANKEALAGLHAAGVSVILCTGRSSATALPILGTLGFDTHVICFNGSCLLAPAAEDGRREVLFERKLPAELNARVFALAERHGHTVNVYDGDDVFAVCKSEVHGALIDRYRKLTGCRYEVVDSYARWHSRAVFKLLVLTGEDGAGSFLEAARREFDPATCHLILGEYFVEFLCPDTHKGVAVKSLCEKLSCGLEAVVGFGDGRNDREFLATVGMGIAVANAAPETKEAAARVSEFEHHQMAVARELQLLFPDELGCTGTTDAPRD